MPGRELPLPHQSSLPPALLLPPLLSVFPLTLSCLHIAGHVCRATLLLFLTLLPLPIVFVGILYATVDGRRRKVGEVVGTAARWVHSTSTGDGNGNGSGSGCRGPSWRGHFIFIVAFFTAA